MKLSTRSRYGTRAMLEIARNYGNGPVKRKDITKNQGISLHYLENILLSLKTKDLILTVRGAHGGFTLKTSPENITMLDIITALEGSIVPVPCVENPETCNKTERCVARIFWIKLHETQAKLLKSTSLQSLLDLESFGYEIDYCI